MLLIQPSAIWWNCVIALGLFVAASSQTEDLDDEFAKVCRPVEKSLDLMFVLDGSGSVGANTFPTQLEIVNRVIDQIEIAPNKTRLAVLQYASWTKVEFDFKTYLNNEAVKNALKTIRYVSGTTKTGKALTHAHKMFSEENGARPNRPDVARVVVLVTDGHSQDDPREPAKALRADGIELLAIGVGDYVSKDGLLEISEDKAKMFTNFSSANFVDTFRRIAVGEICSHAKGQRGAEITCGDEVVTVDVLMKNAFKGHVFIQGFYGDPACTAIGKNVSEGSQVLLKIPFNRCGMQPQFLAQPRGTLYEGTAIVKFHNSLTTKADKAFKIRCFYPETLPEPQNVTGTNETTALSTDIVTKEKLLPGQKARLPCTYTMRSGSPDGCPMKNARVGEKLFHVWECDKQAVGQNFGMLVHSCFITNGQHQEQLIIDEKGCSVDPDVIKTPKYDSKYPKVSVEANSVKIPDFPTVQYKCSVAFCNRLKGECDQILPPKCNAARVKRQGQQQNRKWKMINGRVRPIDPQSGKEIEPAAQHAPQSLQRAASILAPEEVRLAGDTLPLSISLSDKARGLLKLDVGSPNQSVEANKHQPTANSTNVTATATSPHQPNVTVYSGFHASTAPTHENNTMPTPGPFIVHVNTTYTQGNNSTDIEGLTSPSPSEQISESSPSSLNAIFAVNITAQSHQPSTESINATASPAGEIIHPDSTNAEVPTSDKVSTTSPVAEATTESFAFNTTAAFLEDKHSITENASTLENPVASATIPNGTETTEAKSTETASTTVVPSAAAETAATFTVSEAVTNSVAVVLESNTTTSVESSHSTSPSELATVETTRAYATVSPGQLVLAAVLANSESSVKAIAEKELPLEKDVPAVEEKEAAPTTVAPVAEVEFLEFDRSELRSQVLVVADIEDESAPKGSEVAFCESDISKNSTRNSTFRSRRRKFF